MAAASPSWLLSPRHPHPRALALAERPTTSETRCYSSFSPSSKALPVRCRLESGNGSSRTNRRDNSSKNSKNSSVKNGRGRSEVRERNSESRSKETVRSKSQNGSKSSRSNSASNTSRSKSRSTKKSESNPTKEKINAWTTNSIPIISKKILQPEETIRAPSWTTFVGSIAGVWKGKTASFSPLTGKVEPISLGPDMKYQFDASTTCFDQIHHSSEPGFNSRPVVKRQVKWKPLNNPDDNQFQVPGDEIAELESIGEGEGLEGNRPASPTNELLYQSNDIVTGKSIEELDLNDDEDGVEQKTQNSVDIQSNELVGEDEEEIMEENVIKSELGFFVFEDGSYAQCPVDLFPSPPSSPPLDSDGEVEGSGEHPNSEGEWKREEIYGDSLYATPFTFTFEQCLVVGGHKRLRAQQTIAIDREGEDVQLLRLVLFEEIWDSPCGLVLPQESSENEDGLLSKKPRPSPHDISGTWKVFEVVATLTSDSKPKSQTSKPFSILSPSNLHSTTVQSSRPPSSSSSSSSVVYSCRETELRRGLARSAKFKRDDTGSRMDDIATLWLPSGSTFGFDIGQDGSLSLSLGWLEEDNTRLFMECEYDDCGQLIQVRRGSEMKVEDERSPPDLDRA